MAEIIIIEDETALRGMMRKILEAAGHTIRQAANGNEGIQLFRERPPDLIITDLFMPEKDGIETIQELREIADVKILAVSGGATIGPDDPLSDAELFGADSTLAKPFTFQELQEKVEELLQGG